MRWNDKEEKYLIEHYSKLSNVLLARKMGRTVKSIQHRASKLGLKSRRCPVNEEYFDAIDSDAKAYILGFVLADGCVSERGSSNGARLSFGVASKDRCVLEFICKEMEYDPSLIKDCVENRRGVENHCSRLRIGSIKIVDSLCRLNVGPRKTGRETLPPIDDKYFYSFLRGFFDGDGCQVFVNKDKTRTILSFVSASEQLLLSLKEKVGAGSVYRESGKNFYRWKVYRQKDVKRIIECMYDNATFALNRKRKQYGPEICSY